MSLPTPTASPPASLAPSAGGGASRRWRRRLSMVWMERLLLVCMLAGRFSVLHQYWGQQYGHDAGYQMEVSRKVSLWGPRLGLEECFNCYQPPLGFLVPKWMGQLTGLEEVKASQLVGFLFSLVAFFLFRAALRHVGQLHRPAGMALLYLGMAMPVMQYLAYAITLDSQMLFYAAGILWAAVKVFWFKAPGKAVEGNKAWAYVLALVAAESASTMVKYSGFVLFALPCFVAFFQPLRHMGRQAWLRNVGKAVAVGVVSVMMVLPYYYTRYYAAVGRFTPIHTDWIAKEEIEKNRARIQANKTQFLIDLFSPTPTVKDHPDWNDPQTARMHDTWRFFWIRSHVLGWRARDWKLSLFYLDVMPWLLLLGATMLWRTLRRSTPWARLGWVLLAQTVLYGLSMISYNYSTPFPLWITIKAIYVAPAAWGIAYILAHVLQARWVFPLFLARRWRLTQAALLLAVAAYTFFNNHLACY